MTLILNESSLKESTAWANDNTQTDKTTPRDGTVRELLERGALSKVGRRPGLAAGWNMGVWLMLHTCPSPPPPNTQCAGNPLAEKKPHLMTITKQKPTLHT